MGEGSCGGIHPQPDRASARHNVADCGFALLCERPLRRVDRALPIKADIDVGWRQRRQAAERGDRNLAQPRRCGVADPGTILDQPLKSMWTTVPEDPFAGSQLKPKRGGWAPGVRDPSLRIWTETTDKNTALDRNC